MTSRTPSFFHSKRFRKGQISQAVTGVYRINLRTGLLTCAGVVYKKVWPTDNWDRRMHAKLAMERFNSNPLKIQFTTPLYWPEKNSSNQEEIYRRYRILESFIREVFCQYGVKSTGHNDYFMEDAQFLARLQSIQKDIFSPVQQQQVSKPRKSESAKKVVPIKLIPVKRRRVSSDDESSDDDRAGENNHNIHDNRLDSASGLHAAYDRALVRGFGDYYEIGWDPCSDSVMEMFKFFTIFCLMGLYLAYLNNLLTEQMIYNAFSFGLHNVMMPIAKGIRRMIDTQTGNPYDDADSFSMDDD
jgi:hypothetical protein